MADSIRASRSFVLQKIETTFDFLRSDQDDNLSVEMLMVFPIELLKQGNVEMGTELAIAYKRYFDRICQAAGMKVGALSIDRQNWIKGAQRVHKTEWYAENFMRTIVDVYFRALDLDNDSGISFEEWKHFYKLRGITDEDFCRSTFAKMDKNGDGTISKSEFQYAIRQYGLGEDPLVDFSFLYVKK